MKVKITNIQLQDEITFEIEELNEETRLDILNQIRKRGWKDKDCYSEVG